MRLVLDTNVVASAILWGGPPRALLQAARDERIEIITGAEMLAELIDILVRPQKNSRIAPDPDDAVVIGTALAGKADLVVTGDKPLLSIAAYHGVRVTGIVQFHQNR